MSSSNAIKMPSPQQYTEKRPSQVFTPSGIPSHQESTKSISPSPIAVFTSVQHFSSLQAALSDLEKTLLLNGYSKGIIALNMNDVLNMQA